MMAIKRIMSALFTTTILLSTVAILPADANCWRDREGRSHCQNKTGKIIKGGLVGAGVGAGAGYVMGRPVGKTAVLGAGVGAGVQATRHSNYMRRHPIVKSATYGALTGAGAVPLLRREGSPVKGALWGAAIGTGVGAFRHLD